MNNVEALKYLLDGGSICRSNWQPLCRVKLRDGVAYLHTQRNDPDGVAYNAGDLPGLYAGSLKTEWLRWKEPGITEAEMVIGQEYRVRGGLEPVRLLGILPTSVTRRYVFWRYATSSTTVDGVTYQGAVLYQASLEECSLK